MAQIEGALPDSLIVMEGGEFIRYNIDRYPLGQQDQMLRELATSVPVTIPNAFVLGENHCGIQIKSSMFIVWTELFSLAISTVFVPVGNPVEFYPQFKKEPEKNTLETNRTETWIPKLSKLRLFFVAYFVVSEGLYVATKDHCYLIAVKEGANKTIRPPLPNIYTEGRLCMGEFRCSEKTLGAAFARALTHLHNSRWNSDLLDGGLTLEDTRKIFTFKEGVNQPPPARFDITKVAHCRAINNLTYQDLPIYETTTVKS